MRRNRSNDILQYFVEQAPQALTVRTISEKFDISERQVKNYIRQINEVTRPTEILQRGKGAAYSLCPDYDTYLPLFENSEYLPQNRISNIISMLLLTDSDLNIFDLADQLYVSRPTLERDLSKVKQLFAAFDLELYTKNDTIYLNGSEQNKRRVISHMISSEEYSDFMSSDKLKFLNSSYQVENIRKQLIRIFNECHFVFNDYSLNNIVLHLVVTIDRLKHNLTLLDVLPSDLVTDIEQNVARKVAEWLEVEFDVRFSEAELNNLMIFLSCNLATIDYNFVNSKNIAAYVNEYSRKLTEEILAGIREYYMLDEFDDIFVTRFTFHVDNLMKRLENNYSMSNPLNAEIKFTYPFLYDVAVFAADTIQSKTGRLINQDEIALIALHIGGFLENSQKNKNKISAVYVYSDYHGFYKYNIEKIQKKFDNELNIKYSISIGDHMRTELAADLILSECSLGIPGMIKVSPFVTDQELKQIGIFIEQFMKQNKKEQFSAALQSLFHQQLFFTDVYGADEFEVIRKLLDKIRPLGYFEKEFEEDVIKREKLSSTSFHNGVAIPHSISQKVTHSFIAISCCEKGQLWNQENVKLVVVIGIAYQDRKIFRYVFKQIVELFANESCVSALCRCRTYDEILTLINSMVD